MITLLEQVINELRLSKASTGNKLNGAGKNFSELKPGDLMYDYNMDQDWVWIYEFDSFDEKDGWIFGTFVKKINNFKSSNFTSPEDKINSGWCRKCMRIPKDIDTPVFFSQKDYNKPEVNYINATSLDIIKRLMSNEKELKEEIAKGNITK